MDVNEADIILYEGWQDLVVDVLNHDKDDDLYSPTFEMRMLWEDSPIYVMLEDARSEYVADTAHKTVADFKAAGGVEQYDTPGYERRLLPDRKIGTKNPELLKLLASPVVFAHIGHPDAMDGMKAALVIMGEGDGALLIARFASGGYLDFYGHAVSIALFESEEEPGFKAAESGVITHPFTWVQGPPPEDK